MLRNIVVCGLICYGLMYQMLLRGLRYLIESVIIIYLMESVPNVDPL